MSQKAYSKKLAASFQIKSVLATLAYYGALFSFARAGIQAATEEEISKGILGPSTSAWLLAVGTSFFVDKAFVKLLSERWSLVYLGGIIVYTVSGILQGNEPLWLITDILIFIWLIGGVAFFRLMVVAGNAKFHLLAFVSIATFVLYYSQAVALEQATNNVDTLTRVISKGSILFYYSELLLIPTGLALGILVRQGIIWTGLVFILIGLHVFNVTILGAMRSSTLCIMAITLTSSLSLLYRLKNFVITAKTSSYGKLIALFTLAGFIAIGLILKGGLFSEFSLISERVSDDAGSGNMRSEELADALTQVSSLQFVIGGGLGFAFNSTLGYPINALHVGIFTFLLKFGILIFVPLVIFLYLRLPFLYLAAWFRPFSMDAKLRSAILTVLPGIFGWLVIVSLSGGYNQYSFLGLGFGLGAFLHIKDYGLVNFSPSSSK